MRNIIKFLFAGVLTIFFAAGAAVYVQAGTYAIVTGEVVNVRSYGDISDNRLFMVNRGEVIEIHGVSGEFFRATVRGVSDVYISRDWVRIRDTQGLVIASDAWIYDLPEEAGGEPVTTAPVGIRLTVVSVFEDWFGIVLDDETYFIRGDYVEISDFVELPTARIRLVSGNLADDMIALAKTYLGSRYVAGGAGPNGFDCSGFIMYITSHFDINLPRRGRDQAQHGTPVARNEIMPGDLLFFQASWSGNISHVGMYIGDGHMIHAATDRDGVRISDITVNFFARTFVTARRITDL